MSKMLSTRVQRLASRVLRNVQSIEDVDCLVRLYDPQDQIEEDFCNQLDDEIDKSYAKFDGTKRYEHYLSLAEDESDGLLDSCCATCAASAARSKDLRQLSKASAELAAESPESAGIKFKVVIVPGERMLKYVSKDTFSLKDRGFTVFLPGKVRLFPCYNDTGETLRLMIQKDYLSDDPRDKQCCRCSASIDGICHTRCGNCMSWLCSTCMSELTLLEKTWKIKCPTCDYRRDILDAMNELPWHEINRWSNIWRAMYEVMQRKKVTRVAVTILDEDGACFHTLASTTASSRMVGKKKRREIAFIGKNIPTEEQLSSRDSVFVVGDMPEASKGIGSMKTAMKQGVVLSNTDSGYVIEVRDLFAPYSVLVSRDKGLAVPEVEPEYDSSSDCESDYEYVPDRMKPGACFSGYSHARAVEVGTLE